MKRRKKDRDVVSYAWMLLAVVRFSASIPSADAFKLGRNHDATDGQFEVTLPRVQWAVSSLDKSESRVITRRLLSTNETSEDKSVWQKIEEFYSDSNNMAMYCVLPLLVLVYGGCSSIYCIYKCRRYLRRRKHKRLRNEDDSSVAEDEKNDLNQEADPHIGEGGEGQPIKTVSGSTWDDANSSFTGNVGYNVPRKKTPLPWDMPKPDNQIKRQESFAENDDVASREAIAESRESTAMALEREREKLDRKMDASDQGVEQFMKEKKTEEITHNNINTNNNHSNNPPPRLPPSVTKANDFSRFANSKPIEIVPISQKEYQRHMESRNTGWDPLHNRPFDSRASGAGEGGGHDQRTGRESSWSIRDEIMAKYDALTSLAIAKRTADVLRINAQNPDNINGGHYPDTLRRKPGKKKLIFIAE